MRKKITKCLSAGVYHLDASDIDFNIAHLYEHLVLMRFDEYLEKNGVSKYLYGWVSGETFSKVIFFEYGFYNPRTEKLFTEFMKQPKRINIELLDRALLCIQSEDQSIVTVVDLDNAISQLQILDSRRTIQHTSGFQAEDHHDDSRVEPSILSLSPSRNRFKELAIAISITDLSLNEKLTLLRIRPLLQVAVEKDLSNEGVYANSHTQAVATDEDTMLIMSSYSMHSSKPSKKYTEKLTMQAVHNLSNAINSNPDALKDFVDCFQNTATWNSLVIDYYRHTGILASRESIADQINIDRVLSLMNRLNIRVYPVDDKVHSIINAHV